MSDEYFIELIQQAMDELSPEHMAELEHVQILVQDEPTAEQAEKLKLRGDQLLLGLFEGVPRTQRSGYESGLMGDTITIFKHPIMAVTHGDERKLYEQIKRTVWHEIAHYFGLDHDEMAERQNS